MSGETTETKLEARKWERMPPHLRLELESAIARHLTRFGSAHYSLVRDDPRFSPWTGTHLSDRGDKYFDRAIARVKAGMERRRRLSALDLHPPRPLEPQKGPLQSIARFGAADSLTFSEMMQDLLEQRVSLRAELSACYADDGKLDGPKEASKLRRELREVLKEIQVLSTRYQALQTAEVREKIFSRIAEELTDEPGRCVALMSALNKIIEDESGLAGAPGEAS